MLYPPALHRGGTVLLVAPSSPLSEKEPIEAIAAGVEKLGYVPVIGESCRAGHPCGYAAAPAEVKARDIMRGFTDPAIDAIWCVRGGSSAWQLMGKLDFSIIHHNPKPFIGFSDITTLHLGMNQHSRLVTYHGPTANRLLQWGEGDFAWRSLGCALEMGERLRVENPPGEPICSIRPGKARGHLLGGNLSLLAQSIGTPWQPFCDGKILYIEDIGEGVYSLERMLTQLRWAGLFDRANGVVLGAFTRCTNEHRPEYGPEELMRDFFADYPKPVLYNVRSAHCDRMVTLPMGALCRVDGDSCTLDFSRKEPPVWI